ncbi:DUF1027 domain-containing protein [Streptococcus sp. X16XC17]|uniref:YutD family protein n=1 Tax=unclassified Streptococcus TaxID=2608887 RepID=UPI00066FE095|nr:MULTISPECIES: YutD-like domain-containing protein [unclassified Streptococcus]TCD46729.1 DUF1027 domain-containing protein [Streptococcus sp. X16XC17]
MKKDISPEMYNYNKFPGPSFALVGDKVVSENIELNLVDNYREAFDQTAFGQRFSQLMLKFDYIVGDWGNEQLRLKGFYKDDKAVKQDTKISHLEDYLLEFCNFGCAYFVLENPSPLELPEEIEDRPARKRNRNRNRNNRKRKHSGTEAEILPVKPMKKADSTRPDKGQKRDKRGKQAAKEERHFKVTEKVEVGSKRQKNESNRKSNRSRNKKVKTPEVREMKRGFVIRQK